MSFEASLDQVRRFTRDVLMPNEQRVEDEAAVPAEILQQIRDIGLFAISIPESYGGLDFSMEQQVLLTFEFTQASAVYRSIFSTTIGLCSQAILDFGRDDQKQRYLPGMARGDIIGSFALTEPEAGTDAGALTTKAVRDGDTYVINGTKRYITNAPYADVFLVMARTDPDSKGGAGISALLVDAETPGITVGPIPKMLGQTGSASTEVYFEDCRVPASALVGDQEGRGLGAALRGINHARTHVAATCVGQAMRLIDEAVDFAIGREQFGGSIADMPSIQNMLADSYAEMNAARAMTLEAARDFDRAQADGTRLPTTEIAAAKYYGSEMVSRVADRALQIMGGAGFMEGNPITRLYRDTRLFRIFEGTSQIQQRNIARDMVRARRQAA